MAGALRLALGVAALLAASPLVAADTITFGGTVNTNWIRVQNGFSIFVGAGCTGTVTLDASIDRSAAYPVSIAGTPWSITLSGTAIKDSFGEDSADVYYRLNGAGLTAGSCSVFFR